MLYLCIDLAELLNVARFFHLIDLYVKHLKGRKEKEKKYSLQFPNSVSLADCQTFLDTIIQNYFTRKNSFAKATFSSACFSNFYTHRLFLC